MRRRDVMMLIAGTAVLPVMALAQQPAGVPRIGVLRPIGAAPHPSVEELRQGLRDLGYVEGQNIAFEVRYAGGMLERLPALAAELVARNVAVIVTYGPHGTRAAKDATSTIPIVMGRMDDADGHGFIDSLARPGGNITGLSFQSAELSTKWLELMKEVLPPGVRIAVLWDEASTAHQLKTAEDAARSVGVGLHKITVRAAGDFAGAFATAQQVAAKGVVLLASPLFTTQMSRLAGLALTHRLATIYLYRAFAEAGGMIGYGPLETATIELGFYDSKGQIIASDYRP